MVFAILQETKMIPEIVHQIWFQGHDRIPIKFKKNLRENQAIMRHWKYIVWDDVSLRKFFKGLLLPDRTISLEKRYDSFPYLHEKVDFAKYALLWVMGGVYVDMDVKLLKPLDSLVQKFPHAELIVSHMSIDWFTNLLVNRSFNTVNNGIIYAQPQTSVLQDLVTKAHPSCSFLSSCFQLEHVQNSTGPRMFGNLVMQHKSDNIIILPPEFLEPCLQQYCNITENTIAKHQHVCSWGGAIGQQIAGAYSFSPALFWTGILFFLFLVYNCRKS